MIASVILDIKSLNNFFAISLKLKYKIGKFTANFGCEEERKDR